MDIYLKIISTCPITLLQLKPSRIRFRLSKPRWSSSSCTGRRITNLWWCGDTKKIACHMHVKNVVKESSSQSNIISMGIYIPETVRRLVAKIDSDRLRRVRATHNVR